MMGKTVGRSEFHGCCRCHNYEMRHGVDTAGRCEELRRLVRAEAPVWEGRRVNVRKGQCFKGLSRISC